MTLEELASHWIAHLYDALILADHTGRCTAVNAAACALTGYTEAELLHTMVSDLLMPTEPATSQDSAVMLARCKDGAHHPVIVRTLPADGQQVYILRAPPPGHSDVETALREREARSWQTVEQSPNPIFSVNQAGHILSWNRACEDFFQRGRDVIGRPYHILLHAPEDAAVLDAMAAAVFRGESFSDVEIVYRRADSKPRYALSRLYPVLDRAQNVQECVFANTNITERKRAEHALRESEARFRRIFAESPIGIKIFDAGGVFLTANKACLHLFGLSDPAPLAQFGLFDDPLLPGEIKARLRHGEVVRTQLAFDFDQVNAHSPGLTTKSGIIHLDALMTPLGLEQGSTASGYLVQLRDVTEQTTAQGALRESEARYRTLFEGIDDTIIVHDEEANILDVNEAACRRLGYTRDELLHMKATDIEAPDYAAGFKARLARQLREGGLSKIDGVHVARDGRRIHNDVNTKLITYQGQPAILEVARDVTELRRAQEALRRHAEEQTALYAIASVVGASLDPQKLFATVFDWLLPLLDTDAAWVVLSARDASARPEVVAWRGLPDSCCKADLTLHGLACATCAPMLKNQEAVRGPQLIEQCASLTPVLLAERQLQDYVGIPLRVGDRVLGILYVARRAPHTYTDSERALMINIGHQIGIALHNAQLYQAARQVDRLRTLNALDRALAAILDLETAAEVTLERIASALHAQAGVLAVLSASGVPERALVLNQGWIDAAPSVKDMTRTLAVLEQLRLHRDTITLTCDDLTILANEPAFIAQWGESGIVIPICADDELVAVLMLGGRAAHRPFTDDDRELARAAANRAGQTIQNARLYRAARMHADEMALLNEIGLALTSTLDYGEVVRVALSRLQALFEAELVALFQPTPEQDGLRFEQVLYKGKPVEVPLTLHKGEGVANWALEHRQPVLLDDVQADPRWVRRIADYLNMQPRAVMAAPLFTPEHAIGAIVVCSEQRGLYTANHLTTLQAIAPTLAVALENARLYEEQRALLREYEQMQLQLLHSTKMAALGRLMAALAHEINNPLQAVQGFLDLAIEEITDGRRREKLERYLGVVSSEVERIAEILGRSLDFYRPAAQGWRPINIHDVIESVLALTASQLQHGNVTVKCAWGEDIPEIQANPDYLKQVFLNLILNAREAMPHGGELRITTARDQLPATRPAVRIAFRDTGEGIPEAIKPHLFEPFFSDKAHGTGLGLPISYRIVETHGGQIRLDSAVGEGTTVTILLPVEQPEPPG